MAGRSPKKKRWIQKTGIGRHKGRLHRRLGIPQGETLPLELLHEAAEEPGSLGREARLALTLRRLPRRHGKRKARS